MCYTAESGTLAALKYAKYRGDEGIVRKLEAELKQLSILDDPRFHVSGFAHPRLLVFTNLQPYTPQAYWWGLIPAWTKNAAEAKKFWNNTLNARGETIFEKPSFRAAAKQKRCLIYLDAFYEHHHHNKQTYPFRIALKSGEPMALAGLWEEWVDRESGEIIHSTTIVTTHGNALMQKIHNNPKADGPRMPVILPREKQNDWLAPCETENDQKALIELMQPFPQELLEAHSVAKLLGKEAIANVKAVEEEVNYPELQGLLNEH